MMKVDIQTLIYIFFVIIFLISRILKGRKKTAQRNEPRPQVSQQPVETEEKEDPMFGELFGGLLKELEVKEKQQPAPPPMEQLIIPEPKTKPVEPSSEYKVFEKEGVSAFKTDDDESTFVEGEPAVYKQLGGDLIGPDSILGSTEKEEEGFEFDPREAYLLKTLLDRPYK